MGLMFRHTTSTKYTHTKKKKIISQREDLSLVVYQSCVSTERKQASITGRQRAVRSPLSHSPCLSLSHTLSLNRLFLSVPRLVCVTLTFLLCRALISFFSSLPPSCFVVCGYNYWTVLRTYLPTYNYWTRWLNLWLLSVRLLPHPSCSAVCRTWTLDEKTLIASGSLRSTQTELYFKELGRLCNDCSHSM